MRVASFFAALGLAVSGLSPEQTRQLAQRIDGKLTGPLAVLVAPLRAAREGAEPTVAHVRARLAAMRDLESAARPLLQRGVQPQLVHRALALAWQELSDLEAALEIQGEGDEAIRGAVRGMAHARSADAAALARSESDRADAKPLHSSDLLTRLQPELTACYDEHQLRVEGAEAIDALATLELDAGHVSAVSFEPPLANARAPLGECLSTRLLGLPLADDADALELPLHFAPAK